ncbi:DUF3037 domain-containing protein [Siphonobacter aquaeclarae]|nr:DUF3037 domain-containing protein [Siphonobacter aquaeclarae]MBO9639438.1 DUF3037 domain-containing protein [Siphonobacter aquaeclarae]
MPEMHLFEYAVIRLVPRVERGEFLNAGVILSCPSQGFLHTLYQFDEDRLRAFGAPEADFAEWKERLCAFQKICAGRKEGGPIGQLPASVRFRWLTAARSTVVQTSPVHTGLCENAEETLARLFRELVL